jgi:perosamine synthetase
VHVIPWAKPDYWGNERKLVAEALESSWISGGPFVDRLESELSTRLSVPYAVTASNGTTALHMIYLALGIGPGSEVIVPGFAFQAAANVALHVGAKPVFSEVDSETWCMTADAVERCLSPRTRLIVPVHTYGNVCEMDGILELAKARGVTVLEDAAEAFCSKFKGRYAGTLAQAGSFSFHATKTITTGEGGLAVTHDAAIRDRMALYRNHGVAKTRYWHDVAGHNFRLTNLQAALGCAQLERLEQIIRERARVFAHYERRLSGVQGLALQRFTAGVEPVVWAVALKLDPRAFPQGRDAVMKQMTEAQIETRPGFYAASQLPLYGCARLPVCEDVASNVISLPTFPSLSDEQVDLICERLLALRR